MVGRTSREHGMREASVDPISPRFLQGQRDFRQRAAGVAHVVDYQTTSPFDDMCDTGGSLTKVDRKSTRLNSSHGSISYAVFCLKKKNSDEHVLQVLGFTGS